MGGHFIALLTLLLGSCALGPTHPAQPPPVEPADVGLGEAATPPIAAQWWQGFGDSQLDGLIERGLRDNPSLAEALARLNRAQSEATVAGSTLRPQAGVTADEARERLSARSFFPLPYGGGTFWNGTAEAAVGWNLDFWGRQRDRIEAAEQGVRVRGIEVRAARLAIEVSLASQYLELDRDHALLDLAKDTSEARARLLALVQSRVRAGLDTAIEERAALAGLADMRVEAREAAARVQITVHRIAALSGQGASGYAAIGRPQLRLDPQLALPLALPGDLLLRRGDVGSALARVQALTALEHAASRAAYPQINLRAFAGFDAFGLADLLSAPARTLGAGVNTALPIFDAGRLRGELHGAGADVDLAIAAYHATVLTAVREAADQLAILAATLLEVDDARARVEIVDGAHRLAVARRDAGLTGEVAVLEARLRLLAARRVLVTLQCSAATARVALIAALGGSPLDPPTPVLIVSRGTT